MHLTLGVQRFRTETENLGLKDLGSETHSIFLPRFIPAPLRFHFCMMANKAELADLPVTLRSAVWRQFGFPVDINRKFPLNTCPLRYGSDPVLLRCLPRRSTVDSWRRKAEEFPR